MTAINWLGAWLLFLLIMLAIVQTKIGNKLVYYLLWLAVILLLVKNYKQVTNLLAAGGIVPNVN